MKHVVVDVAEEGGIHQIRGRYGEIQRQLAPRECNELDEDSACSASE